LKSKHESIQKKTNMNEKHKPATLAVNNIQPAAIEEIQETDPLPSLKSIVNGITNLQI